MILSLLISLAALPLPASTQPADIVSILEPIRKRNDLPALAAAVIRGDKVVALGAVGMRRYHGTVKVTVEDQFHLGSDTKAMTATLIGMLVDEGKLKWTSTLGVIFAAEKGMLPAYRGVTIEQLLNQRGGFPGETSPPGQTLLSLHGLRGTPRQQRDAYVHMALATPPEAPPGTKFIYSNMGYTIAGAIVEQVTGKSWEEAVTERLFKPLGMKSAGFGPMGTPGKEDQPLQHRANHAAEPPGPFADNPVCIAPAGLIHCSIGDWAKFAIAHLRGETAGGLVKPETFRKLHSAPRGSDYAMGWIVAPRPWAGGNALAHDGSNTLNYATAWLAPKRDFAVLICTNIGGDTAAAACDQTAGALIQQYLSPN